MCRDPIENKVSNKETKKSLIELKLEKPKSID